MKKSADADVCAPFLCARSSLFSASRNHLNLEKSGPELSGHKQPIVRRVVSNPIQHRIPAAYLDRRQQSPQLNGAQHAPVCRRDANNLICHPHIGINFTVNVLELIQLSTGFPWSVTWMLRTSANVFGFRK